jgi:hypothetical protein
VQYCIRVYHKYGKVRVYICIKEMGYTEYRNMLAIRKTGNNSERFLQMKSIVIEIIQHICDTIVIIFIIIITC